MRLIYIISIIILSFFTACKKEKGYDECDTLYDVYKPTGFTTGTIYTKMDRMQFMYASINPNNPNEVVYQGGLEPNWYIYTYNILTKQRYKLSNLLPTHNVKWHKSGWITFAGEDNNIYIVKPNGDSLTKLTTTGDCFTPEWNSGGDKIICFKAFNNTGNYIINKDESGIEVALTGGNKGVQTCSWSPNDSIIAAAVSTNFRFVYIHEGYQENVTYNKPKAVDISGVCWMPDGKRILWCPESQPEILDISTGNSQALLPFCDKMEYTYPSVTADGRYALFNLNIGGYVANNTTQTKRRLSVIDLTTNTETILDLPE